MSSKHTAGSQRRKASKRPLVHSDEDEDDGDVPVPATAQRMKRARTADTDASLSTTTTHDGDSDMDVDAETFRGSVRRSLSVTDDSHFYPDTDPSLSHKTRGDGSKKRKAVVSTSTKWKPQVVDSEESDGSMERYSGEDDLSDIAPPLSEHNSDDVDPDTPPKRGASKAKASTSKGRAGKARPGQLKGARTKGSKDKEREKDREIHVKDERRPLPSISTPRASSTHSQPLDLFSNEDRISPAVDPLPDVTQPTKDPLAQTIPKKRKLPPIKKTKASGVTATSTPSIATQKPAPPPVQELAKPLLPTSEQRKQALTGVRDINLADSKIYAELFKGAGGNTPRSGLKNAEERRRELDRMRDEARARRHEEAKYTFDLQSQADKIAQFEQRLRAENSTVLHPNFLAAKFRDEWELDRRNRCTVPKEEGEA